MPVTLILHIQNSDAVLGEAESIPTATDRLILIRNPRRIDGKEVSFITQNVDIVLFPVERLNFIEVQSGGEEEEIFGFVRE